MILKHVGVQNCFVIVFLQPEASVAELKRYDVTSVYNV